MEKSDGMDLKQVTDFAQVAGQGVRGVIDGKKILAGNYKMMSENNVRVTEDTHFAKEGKPRFTLRQITNLSEL